MFPNTDITCCAPFGRSCVRTYAPLLSKACTHCHLRYGLKYAHSSLFPLRSTEYLRKQLYLHALFDVLTCSDNLRGDSVIMDGHVPGASARGVLVV